MQESNEFYFTVVHGWAFDGKAAKMPALPWVIHPEVVFHDLNSQPGAASGGLYIGSHTNTMLALAATVAIQLPGTAAKATGDTYANFIAVVLRPEPLVH